MIADRAAQHRIGRLERVQHRPQRHVAAHVYLYFASDARQRLEMRGKLDSNHVRAAPKLAL